MRYFDIRHSVSWPEYGRNAELAELIYEQGMGFVNQGNWAYINPAAGFGIFEDGDGNFLFLETMERGAELRILDMHCGFKDEAPSEMSHFIDAFIVKFGLVKAPMEDA